MALMAMSVDAADVSEAEDSPLPPVADCWDRSGCVAILDVERMEAALRCIRSVYLVNSAGLNVRGAVKKISEADGMQFHKLKSPILWAGLDLGCAGGVGRIIISAILS